MMGIIENGKYNMSVSQGPKKRQKPQSNLNRESLMQIIIKCNKALSTKE